MAKKTKEEIAQLDQQILAAEEAHDEVYLNYLMRIRKMTIHVHDGGTVIMQSGSPPPLPPY